ncbi:WRKY transcription factor WRKY51-like [Miscanthus floridulus]|uniref:WRKY transcription factor WRKY51-like n=1 Tax=Miscanthus floridulus TaxID=154761 RepID=UPI003457E222
MAVDLMSCGGGAGAYEQLAFQEAAAAGLRSLELLASSLSSPCAAGRAESPPLGQIADQAVSRFRRVINLLDRTGHARFRRAPVAAVVEPMETETTLQAASLAAAEQPPQKKALLALDFTEPVPVPVPAVAGTKAAAPAVSGTSTSFLSSVTAGGGEGSVSKGCSLAVSSGKPPLPKRKLPCPTSVPQQAHHQHQHQHPAESGGAGGRCHCSKKKGSRQGLSRRTVRVPEAAAAAPGSHVPASSDIPADDYSWRKYGQKPIKGSPYPRGYYRCSSVKGCPARKHVERAADDPAMLVVTYEGDHRHDAAAGAVRSLAA